MSYVPAPHFGKCLRKPKKLSTILGHHSFSTSGSVTNEDIEKFELWVGTEDSINSTKTQKIIDTGENWSYTNGLQTLTFSYQMEQSSSRFFWITADFKGDAITGRNIEVAALTEENITTTGSKVIAKHQEVHAGATQTIVEISTILSFDNPVPPQSLSQDSKNNHIFRFELESTGANFLKNVSFTTESSNLTVSDFSEIALYASVTNNFSNEDKISSITSLANNGNNTFSLENKPYKLISGHKHYFWITIDLEAGATEGNTIKIAGFGTGNVTLEHNDNKSGSATVGATQTIVAPSTTLGTGNFAVPSATVSRGMKEVPIYAFSLNSSGSNSLTSVSFTVNGTDLESNIDKYQLYRSTAGTFSTASWVEADIETIPTSGNVVKFDGLNLPHADDIIQYYWITADINGDAAVDNTITVAGFTSDNDVSPNIEMVQGGVSGSSPIGGTQTIGWPKLTVSTTEPAIPAGTVSINSRRNPVYRFSMQRDSSESDNTTVNSITITTVGNYEDRNFKQFRLGMSPIDNCVTASPIAAVNSVDRVLVTQNNQITRQYTFTFAENPLVFQPGETKYFWISAGTEEVTESSDQGQGNTFYVSALTRDSFEIEDTRMSISAHPGGLQTIGKVKVFYSAESPELTPNTEMRLSPGHKKRTLFRFALESCGNVNIDKVDFTTSGDYLASDFDRFELWTGLEDDLGAAGQLQEITDGLSMGSHSFTSIALPLNPNTPQYFWITADASNEAVHANEIYVEPITVTPSYGDIVPATDNPTAFSNSGTPQVLCRNSDWKYSKGQTIEQISGAGSGYQIKVVVHRSEGIDFNENVYVGTNSRKDFGDIRFYEGNIPLDYWMESSIYGKSAAFWVKLNGNLSNNSIYLTMRYGNMAATTTSDGYATFDFFDDFNRTNNNLDNWKIHKPTADVSKNHIEIPKGSNFVRIADGNKTQDFGYGHAVLGSVNSYDGFTNGIIEFRYSMAVDGIAEVGFRGTPGNGYKGRSDARTDGEGGQSFLENGLDEWPFLDGSAPGTNPPLPFTWYRGMITALGNQVLFHRDEIQYASSNSATDGSPGEISLQNHYGSYADFDWIFVRKAAVQEPYRSYWQSVPLAKEASAVNYNGFTAHWNECPDADKYYIDVYKIDGTPVAEWTNREVENNIVRVEELEPGTSYRYHVRTWCPTKKFSKNSNYIGKATISESPGYGASTSINGEEAIVFIPPVIGNADNNVTIGAVSDGSTEDFTVNISYHSGGYSIWPNGRLLASIKSTNVSALNRSYTIYHDGMTTPAVAAWRFGDDDEDWHHFSEDNATFTDEYTTVTISGIEPMRSQPVLEILLNDGSPTLPVELSSFTAKINAYGKITIEWVTQTETNLMGYRIYRNNLRDLDSATLLDALIEARNTSQTQVYTYSDNELLEPGNYFYWLESVDFDGTMQYYGPVRVEINDSDTNNQVPIIAGINHTYPNPFNPDIHIAFGVPEPAKVKMIIYNIRGQRVSEILNEDYGKGNHTFTWTGTDDRGRQLSSGLYFLRMEMDKKTWIK